MKVEIIKLFGTAGDCLRSICKDLTAYRPVEVEKVSKVIGLIKAGDEYYQVRMEIDKNRDEFTPENLEMTESLEEA